MCGIAGILKFDPREPVEEGRLKGMRDTLIHRGPDDEGLWIDGRVGLAHRRLAIVDIQGGHQPMANEACTERGRDHLWIVFNGEIYNHTDLRRELKALGHGYRTRSDTETILHLYEEMGDCCVERLQGMFAFAIWDRARCRLFLARDRLGIKPLYYASTEGELLFASEIKAILAAAPFRSELNEAVLPEYLSRRFVAGEETLFRGVKKLLPGRTLTWSLKEGFRERRYWWLPTAVEESNRALDSQAWELRDRLKETVRSHLMSDVPLGVFLSGGLDSSGAAALMARMMAEPLQTFSVGFSEKEANELPYARLVASSIGAEHHEVVVSPSEFFEALPTLIWHEDEPIAFPSSIPLYFVSRLARQHVKVVLTGEGADELFLGYPWYRATVWNERLGRPYWRLVPPSLRSSVPGLLERLPGSLRRYATRSFLAHEPSPRALYLENFAVFPERQQRRLLASPELLDFRDPYAATLAYYDEHSGDSPARMSHCDLQSYLVELLMKQDQMSMAASVESRVPFLDHELVEHVVGLPSRFKLRGWRTKVILREAFRGLVPREILTRAKMGFPVPIGPWLQGQFWPMVQEFVLSPRTLERKLFLSTFLRQLAEEHRTGTRNHADRLWLLINLEIWQRIFLDGEPPDRHPPFHRAEPKGFPRRASENHRIATPRSSLQAGLT